MLKLQEIRQIDDFGKNGQNSTFCLSKRAIGVLGLIWCTGTQKAKTWFLY